MKKLYLLFVALFVSAFTFGQTVDIMHESFGDGGYWMGAMNTNPNLTSVAMFSDDNARTQTWNASGQSYEGNSKGFHVILADTDPGDTVRFMIPTNGFTNIVFSHGVYTWGAVGGQVEAAYSTDGISWTIFDESALTTGDPSGSAWQLFTYSEILPEADELHIKVYRTAPQIHLDDLRLTAETTTDNALLSTVSLDVGSIDFAFYTNDYEVWVPYGTSATPVITAEAFDADASVSITDAADITSATEADRTSTIEVTAEDGTTINTYTILFNVTPPRENATLNDIELGYATLAPAFESDRLRYLVDLPDTATVAPSVNPLVADNAATVTITGPTDISAADAADRTAFIEVVAQDGVTSVTYEVVFKVGGGSTDLFVIDYETFGNEGNKFDIVLSSYAGFTSDWAWGDQNVHIRTSNPSTGYDLASGNNRIEVQAGWGAQGNDTLVFTANTSQFSNVTLATGIYNNTGADVGASVAFKAYYSTDSMTWTAIGNELVMGTEFPTAGTWSYIITDDVLPSAEEVYIMLANEDANFEYYLDDITLWGTPLNTNNQLATLEVSDGTLDPEFDPNELSYTVALPQRTMDVPTVTASVLSPSAVIDQVDATDVRSLVDAEKTTTLTVTAENGSEAVYEVYFDVYMSDTATLDELSVAGLPLSPGFSNDIMSYAVKLPAGTTTAPDVTAVATSPFADVVVEGPIDINSSDVADRTVTITVTAENMVDMKMFEIVYTFGSLDDVRFNIAQEKFSTTGTFEVEDYPGYTTDAMFDGDEHKWDSRSTGEYPVASQGAAIKFGEWAAEPTYVEMVMKQKIDGYKDIMLSFGMEHNSGGWGDGGCGLTNNFILVEYTTDSVNWVAMNMDSLTVSSLPYPCGGAPFSFVDMAYVIPTDEEGYVTLRFTHTDGTIHPFYIDDIVLSGSPISTDASLFDLSSSLGDLDPLFDPTVTDYTVELPIGSTDTPELTAIAAEDSSDVEIVDAVDVTSDVEADRTSMVTVTAPDGETMMTYTVVFNVLPNNDPTLSALTVAGDWTLDPAFAATTFDYEVELTMGTTETPAVTATPTDPNATVDVTDAADVTSEPVADRTTEIVVTAEDGTTSVTYTVVFTGAIVSAKDAEAEMISVYPNPTAGKLYISKGDMIKSVTVTNMAGQVIMTGANTSSAEIELDVSNLSQGFYNVSIETNEGDHIIRSFIKN